MNVISRAAEVARAFVSQYDDTISSIAVLGTNALVTQEKLERLTDRTAELLKAVAELERDYSTFREQKMKEARS